MAKINAKGLTEKGVVRNEIRKAIVEKEVNNFLNNDLKGYDRVEEKGLLIKEYATENGVIYVSFNLVVSHVNPTEKGKKEKKDTKKEETFEINE